MIKKTFHFTCQHLAGYKNNYYDASNRHLIISKYWLGWGKGRGIQTQSRLHTITRMNRDGLNYSSIWISDHNIQVIITWHNKNVFQRLLICCVLVSSFLYNAKVGPAKTTMQPVDSVHQRHWDQYRKLSKSIGSPKYFYFRGVTKSFIPPKVRHHTC